jgi:tetratricopeptide (TPR) repeat protein
MNWKIVGIVTVAVLSLIGIGGSIYGMYKFFHSFALVQSRIQCNSQDADISIRGCTAILAAKNADNGQQTFAYFRRALAYEHKGDLDHAIADDSEVIRLNPREYMAYTNRGVAYQRKGDLKRAIADYSQAIDYVPEMSLARFNRAEAYSIQGNYPLAIDDLTHVVQHEPGNSVAWNNRCYFRAIAGQLEDALSDCNQSLKLRPNVGETLDSRGFTYLKMKKYELAIADYNAAEAAGGEQAPWLYGRGLARRATHDEAGAKADIAAAVKLDPTVAATFRKYGVS